MAPVILKLDDFLFVCSGRSRPGLGHRHIHIPDGCGSNSQFCLPMNPELAAESPSRPGTTDGKVAVWVTLKTRNRGRAIATRGCPRSHRPALGGRASENVRIVVAKP